MPTSSAAQLDPSREQCTDPALLDALTAPAMYEGSLPVLVHETHASWVFVAGERAYKIKKPVALGFLDYSTLSRRHAACHEEVRVNQELAPGIYLGVRALVRTPHGFRFAAEGTPNAVEYAVEMQSFSEADTMEGMIAAGALTPSDIQDIARRLAGFHRSAPAVAGGGPSQVLETWRANMQELGRLEHPGPWHMDTMSRFGEAFVNSHVKEIEQRKRDGHVRDGHGDLRCEHVLVRPAVRVVDRIEFDPALRRTDIACDLAFLAMDLEAHGQRWAARELVSAYLQAGGSAGGEALRSFYAAHRALVRGKVTLIDAAEHEPNVRGARIECAQRLWTLAERLCWRARRPLAIVVCGPAASGKSTLTAELSRRAQLPVVSSDVVRKRLAHLAPFEPGGAEHYSAGFTRATYEQLGRNALLALHRNDGVIVDATCRSRGDRALLMGRLQRTGTTCLVVRCEVSLELAVARAARRMHDPQRVSDATPQIAAEQFRAFEELDERSEGSVLRLDATQALDAQVAAVAHAVDRAEVRRGGGRVEACTGFGESPRRAGSGPRLASSVHVTAQVQVLIDGDHRASQGSGRSPCPRGGRSGEPNWV
jgi:aminoglycoside phosphotransferase family enzyme/predicted kinase